MPSHYLDQCWNIVNWTPKNKLQWNFNQNSCIFIQENPFEYVVWKMAALSSRPRCVNNVQWRNVVHIAGIPPRYPWRAPHWKGLSDVSFLLITESQYKIKSFIASSFYGLLSAAFQWRHNERDGDSNHRLLGCLLYRLFRRRSQKTSQLRITGHFKGNTPVTGGFL